MHIYGYGQIKISISHPELRFITVPYVSTWPWTCNIKLSVPEWNAPNRWRSARTCQQGVGVRSTSRTFNRETRVPVPYKRVRRLNPSKITQRNQERGGWSFRLLYTHNTAGGSTYTEEEMCHKGSAPSFNEIKGTGPSNTRGGTKPKWLRPASQNTDDSICLEFILF